jgi:hypothetical protein
VVLQERGQLVGDRGPPREVIHSGREFPI